MAPRQLTHREMKQLFIMQNHILELVSENVPLPSILDVLLKTVEKLSEDKVIASILLLNSDNNSLHYISAPSLPASYLQEMGNISVGEKTLVCGMAVYYKKMIYSSDIEHDPLWAEYRSRVLSHGLHSCWSTPIYHNKNIIGVFTMYYKEPRSPSERDKMIVNFVMNITSIAIEKKRIIEQLKESEERFRCLSQSSPTGIWVANKEGDIIYTNPRLQEICDFTAEEALGDGWMKSIYSDDFDKSTKLWCDGIKDHREYTYERRAIRKDGTIRWLKVRSAPMFSGQKYLGRTGSVEDITEIKIAEERKDEFLRMTSHELKTPVTSLKGFTQLLQRRFKQRGDTETLHFLDIMNQQLDRLTELISDLLDLSKIQIGKLFYREESFDFDIFIEQFLEQFQMTISTHQIILEGKTYAQIFGDKDRIAQVLINLLTNAAKYSPHADRVIVSLSTEQRCVRVDVQDFGLGIPEDQIERIFDQFYQVNNPESKTYPGLGIGLYLSREIIHRHNGKIWAQSKKGEGSTFSFYLPIII